MKKKNEPSYLKRLNTKPSNRKVGQTFILPASSGQLTENSVTSDGSGKIFSFKKSITLAEVKKNFITVIIQVYFEKNNLIFEGYDVAKRMMNAPDHNYNITVNKKNVRHVCSILNVVESNQVDLLNAIKKKFDNKNCFTRIADFFINNKIECVNFEWD